jgi:hypothetical protein
MGGPVTMAAWSLCTGPRACIPMSKIILATMVAVVLAAAVALNPSADQHRARIRTALSERSPLAAALGVGALTAFASTYHSVGVGSYTVVQGRTVSVGAFGLVIVVE